MGLTIHEVLDWSSYKNSHKFLQNVSDVRVPEKAQGTFKFKRKGKGEYVVPSSRPINFDSVDKSMLKEIWSRLVRSDFDFTRLRNICPPDLLFEIQRTYYALLFWTFTPGQKRYSLEYIMRCTLLDGPQFADRISDEWDYGIRRFFYAGISTSFNEWEPIKHYNELPPVSYLIRWQEDCDDIKYMKIPLDEWDTDLLDEFRSEVMSNLPDDIEIPLDIEILSEVKTSTSFDLYSMKSIPFYKARMSEIGEKFSHSFKAKRTIIPVGPTNYRDSVVTSIDTYNSIKWCDLVIGTLLDDEECSLINNNPQVFNRRLRGMTKIPKSGEIYWLRDIKKCGLTFPRRLFHIVQECLAEKYPDKDFSRFDIYRNYNIYDSDGKLIQGITRGFCLGMANNLVTFIQCMLYNLLSSRIPPQFEIEALFGNDDSCLKVKTRDKDQVITEEDAMLIQCEDFNILHGLNIITNDKKSFWSWYPILFEEYGHQDFKTKHSRIACAMSSAMLAPDVKYAKMLTSALSLTLWDNDSWIMKPINLLLERWGFEYYPDEVNYDYLLGGWFSLRSYGCNIALRQIVSAPESALRNIWRAMNEVNQFQKDVIKPVLSGSVTKNYSVTGKVLNITYVDTEVYNDPAVPVGTIFLNKKSFMSFYGSIYRFNKNPYNEMARKLKRVISTKTSSSFQCREQLEEFIMVNASRLAIPQEHTAGTTHMYDISYNENLDCSSLMRNSLSRYIMKLKGDHLLMCPDLDVLPSGEYPYVRAYDATPFTEKVEKVTTQDGNIPNGIYQYSTNPWLPLFEFTKSYNMFPIALNRTVEDKPHLPEWFMNGQFKDSREVSLAYNCMDWGEETVMAILDDLREHNRDRPVEKPKEVQEVPLCDFCRMGFFTQYVQEDDLWVANSMECAICMLGDDLWRSRRLSQVADSVEERRENTLSVPKIRSRMKHLIEKFLPEYTAFLPTLCQEPKEEEHSLYVGFDSDEEEGGAFDMFGED